VSEGEVVTLVGTTVAAQLPAAVAAGTTGKLDKTEAIATYAPVANGRPRGNFVVVIGDSNIASVADGDVRRVGHNWFNLLCAMTRQRIGYGGYFATSGATAETILANHIPQVIAMNPRPSACIISAGTNNVTALSIPTLQPLWLAAMAALRAAGIIPILTTLPPRDTTSGEQGVAKFNTWITRLAAIEGAALIPLHDPLTDPVTGWYKAGYSGDGTHFSGDVAFKAADYIRGRGLPETFPARAPYTTKSVMDSTNLLQNGVFIGDSNADGHADIWTGTSATGVARSLVVPTLADDLAGNWQQMVRSPGGTSTVILSQVSIVTGWAVGDLLAFACRVQSVGYVASGQTFTAQVQFVGSGAHNLEASYSWKVDMPDGLLYSEGAVPAGTTSLSVTVSSTVPATGTTTLRIGEMTLRNLTAAAA